MFATRHARFTQRLLLVGSLVFAFLLVQGLRVHVHTIADHASQHGHDHAVELHVGGLPTDSGHDGLEDETTLAKYAILKAKTRHTDVFLVPLDTALLLSTLVLTGRVPWWAAHLLPPTPSGDVRTPPLRAPPF